MTASTIDSSSAASTPVSDTTATDTDNSAGLTVSTANANETAQTAPEDQSDGIMNTNN